ncbi:MAG: FHA domain-containing protein [Myxococcales bacterium]|nr:FHA domain-containing protein [Myxococcales bacterium]
MAHLVHQSTKKANTLAARVVVGRSRACHLRLLARRVSGEHATITWNGTGWAVRDLGSRNGTFVDARQLGVGEVAPLAAGGQVAFGDPEDVWVLGDAGAPVAQAVPLPSGRPREAVGSLLTLPSDENPRVAVFPDEEGGWIAEDDMRQFAVADQQEIRVDDQVYRLYLPSVLPDTLALPTQAAAPGLARLQLRLEISRDQESVRMAYDVGRGWTELEPRAHHHLVAVLARLRLNDKEPVAAERGWVHIEELATLAALDPRTINVYISRARRELAGEGLDGAAGLIERRPGTGTLRVGVARITLVDL